LEKFRQSLTKTFSIIVFLMLTALGLKSQQTHFIYIQSEDKQPFYLRFKEKIISSSESGYLIAPKLEQGQLNFILGFPKNAWPSSSYSLEIESKDLGFQLKKVDDLTWALYNIQTTELLSPVEVNKVSNQIIETSTDEFTNILAEVSNTPSVKQRKINTENNSTGLASNIDSSSIAKENITIDSSVTEIIGVRVPVETKPVVVKEKKEKKSKIRLEPSNIKQDFSFLDSTGRSLTYTIKEGDVEDHVVVFISYEKPLVFPKVEPDSIIPMVVEQTITPDNTQTQVQQVIRCSTNAEGNDFLKLRRKMTQEDNEEKMIEVAEKSFKDKCYSTDQVRYLAVLFINEDNRLSFIRMSVNYISDLSLFGTLQQLFNTEKNINRFKEITY
jgi:Domain of unknown function (DUF4476)